MGKIIFRYAAHYVQRIRTVWLQRISVFCVKIIYPDSHCNHRRPVVFQHFATAAHTCTPQGRQAVFGSINIYTAVWREYFNNNHRNEAVYDGGGADLPQKRVVNKVQTDRTNCAGPWRMRFIVLLLLYTVIVSRHCLALESLQFFFLSLFCYGIYYFTRAFRLNKLTKNRWLCVCFFLFPFDET